MLSTVCDTTANLTGRSCCFLPRAALCQQLTAAKWAASQTAARFTMPPLWILGYNIRAGKLAKQFKGRARFTLLISRFYNPAFYHTSQILQQCFRPLQILHLCCKTYIYRGELRADPQLQRTLKTIQTSSINLFCLCLITAYTHKGTEKLSADLLAEVILLLCNACEIQLQGPDRSLKYLCIICTHTVWWGRGIVLRSFFSFIFFF